MKMMWLFWYDMWMSNACQDTSKRTSPSTTTLSRLSYSIRSSDNKIYEHLYNLSVKQVSLWATLRQQMLRAWVE